jgi:hypothetical protein
VVRDSVADAMLKLHFAGRKLMIVCLKVGQLLKGSVLSIGISTLASGSYMAAHPHQEINPSPDQPTEWVVVRSDGEAVVVNLTKALNGECVVEDEE